METIQLKISMAHYFSFLSFKLLGVNYDFFFFVFSCEAMDQLSVTQLIIICSLNCIRLLYN